MTARAAILAVEILGAAGIPAGLQHLNPRPSTGYCRLLLLGGDRRVERGFVRDRFIEVEAWHPRPTPAIELAERALDTLLAAAGSNEIRQLWVEQETNELPTGEDGWQRYRFTVGMSFRTPTERIDRS